MGEQELITIINKIFNDLENLPIPSKVKLLQIIKRTLKKHDLTETANADKVVDISINSEGNISFIFLDNEKLCCESFLDLKNMGCRIPPPIHKIPWELPSAVKIREAFEADDDSKLFNDLERYLKNIADVQDSKLYLLFTTFIFHTYLFDKGNYSPYIWFHGPPERGKSRMGKAIIFCCWRGIYTETVREAYLVRVPKLFGCTIFLDVENIWDRANGAILDVLLHRYEKGGKALRVSPDKDLFDTLDFFPIFGPTIIATNHEVPRTLSSRSIEINMPVSKKVFQNDVKVEDGLPFRERLLGFRARYLNKELPEVEKPTTGRLGDITKPLYQIMKLIVPDREGEFLSILQDIKTRQLNERSESKEAKLVQALLDLEDEGKEGLLSIKRITELFNVGLQEKAIWTPQKIGRKLRAMGLEGSRTHAERFVVYDTDKIEALAIYYDLCKTN